jgi:ABC-type antimicrobial peptide transport system permease subunit
VIAVPDSDRSRTLLLGRYVLAQKTLQCLSPPNVVGELLTIVFRVERVFRVSSLIAGVVTILLTGLVMSLSIRLRSEEFRTMFFLGCSRGTVVRLAATELLVLFVMSSLLAAAAAWLTSVMAADILRQLIF